MKFCWFIVPIFCSVLACSPTTPAPQLACSFTHTPFINPRIIQELSTWISDHDDQVVTVDLLHSQKSNRFFCDTKARNIKGQFPYVYAASDDQANPTEFGYQFIGKTSSGIYVLVLSENDGGSGIFKKLMLLKLEQDEAISLDWTYGMVRLDQPRILLKKVGEVELGDRWTGDLKVAGDSIQIGKDLGWYAGTTNLSGKKTISLKIVGHP